MANNNFYDFKSNKPYQLYCYNDLLGLNDSIIHSFDMLRVGEILGILVYGDVAKAILETLFTKNEDVFQYFGNMDPETIDDIPMYLLMLQYDGRISFYDVDTIFDEALEEEVELLFVDEDKIGGNFAQMLHEDGYIRSENVLLFDMKEQFYIYSFFV